MRRPLPRRAARTPATGVARPVPDLEIAIDALDIPKIRPFWLVTDEPAKSFWVLPDAEGNEICTWQDRD